jgi:hypothetical protein
MASIASVSAETPKEGIAICSDTLVGPKLAFKAFVSWAGTAA